MAKTKKLLSVFLALLMMLTVFPASMIASAANATTVTVESVNAVPGSNVEVNINVKNNPGILAANFTVTYDKGLTLIDSKSGDAFSALSMTKPENYNSPCKFGWDALEIADKDIKDGTILTLTFSVDKGVSANSKLNVKLSYQNGNIIDSDLNDIPVTINNGSVTIIDYIPGDINGDGTIDLKDVTLVRRLVTGYSVTANKLAADVNGDGEITMKDVVLIRRYVVDAEGYGVTLVPGGSNVHTHTMTATAAKAATCTENGNIAYWYCSSCEKYFTDKDGNNVVSQADTVIKAKGHTIVIDAAVDPTYETTGLTEGSHCSTCKAVLKKQEVIPKLQKTEYSITYHISNGDEYLAQQTIQNDNPATYTSEQGVSKFANPSVPGYQFLGWYDLPSGDAAENIKSIPAGTTGNIDLYARWEKLTYKVNFSSDLIPVSSISYTVDEGAVLPSPKLDGYIFAGWSNDNGDVIKNIAIGVTGSKTYKANWVSERNLAWSKTKLDDPMILEDDKTNTILFTYEIGEIRNVPLYVVEDFGKINSDGITKTVTKEIQKTTSTSEMQKYTNTIAKATTDSFGMTLSNGWTDSTTISNEWCEENGLSTTEGETIAKSNTSGWYVSNGGYGSDTDVTLDTRDEYNLNTATKNTKTYNSKDTEKRQDFSAGLNVNYKQTVGASAGLGDGIGIEGKSELGVGADLKYSNGKTTTSHTGKDKDKGSSDQTGDVKHKGTTHTHDGGWNTESGSSGSSTVSNTKSLLQTVTKNVSEKTGYGKSYIKTGSDTSSQGFSSTNSDTEEYSNTVTYSTEVSEKETVSYTTSNARSGYHRWVYAGTAHVFGVVGYDIATGSYFVNTISIMDDETHPYEDYSYSYSSYDDNQSTYIKFEVPNDIEKYVANRVCKSDGLEINNEGIVTGYNGTDDYVLIPEYNVVDNLDGTATVNKVVGFTEDAFKNNTKIYGVELSDFITKIPDYAFSGCSKLDTVVGNTITSVGSYAFANCTSLKVCGIGDDVTYLGDKAFENLDYMVVNASNNQVLNAATNSGAKKITIYAAVDAKPFENIEINIPSTCEKFKFNGMGKTFNNVVINSDAKETIINRATFNSTAKIPIIINSPKIGLYQLTINSKGIGLAFKNDNSNIELYGPVSINSEGQNSILSKNFTLNKLESNFTSLLKTNHDILCCGKITDNGLLNCGGSIVKITEDEFNAQLKGVYNISFDTNGADTHLNDKIVYYGAKIGELPTPTRDYYSFDGWYTAKDGGDKITEASVFSSAENITLYAHWTKNPTSDWVPESALPEGANVVDQKWTYDLTSKTSSSSSSMSGWTKYDTKRTGWGGTQGPVYSNPSNGSRNVWSEQYETSSTPHYNYYRYAAQEYGGQSSPGWQNDKQNAYYYTTDSELQYGGESSSSGVTVSWYKMWNGSKYFAVYKCGTGYNTGGTYVTYTHTYGTRWYYQEPVYTYYYKKTEAKESSTEVKASDSISNVKKYVKYINK